MTINERFTTLINTLYGGNKRAFATASGISPTVVENIVGSRQGKPSFDVLTRVCANANISERWLISGEGEMIRKPVDNNYTEAEPGSVMACNVRPRADVASRPRLPLSAAAGTLSIATESVAERDCEQMPVIEAFPSYDFTIPIEGESMAPDYLPDDELACRFCTADNIRWGRPHVLDTRDGVVFKRIYDGGSSILCRSINPAYNDFEVDKEDVLHVAEVVGFLRHAR